MKRFPLIKPTMLLEGGKAAGLRTLQRAGLAVPPFMVLDANWFSASLDLGNRQLLSDWLSPERRQRLEQQLADWGDAAFPLAVRSSAVGEDGQQHAYPGMLDTVLDVQDWEGLMAAIERVACSIWSERVVAYQQEKGIRAPLLPAVIVQQQPLAQHSGVLFTSYPPYPNELLVHAVPGKGDGLVGGQLEPAEAAFDKNSGRLYWQSEAPHALPEAAFLQELYEVGSRLELAHRQPLDLEFCIADGRIWWLQLRPVTTPLADQLVLDNANIQESYCGVTTELTYSFAQRAYHTVYEQTMHALGLPERKIAAMQPIVSQLLHRYRGRIYYNINHWYQGLLLLPSFSQNKADMERMMGLEEPVAMVRDKRTAWYQKIVKTPRLLLNLLRLLFAFRRLPRETSAFQQRFAHFFDAFYAAQPSNFSEADCYHWYERLRVELLERWHVPIVNDFYVMMQHGKLHRKLQQQGIRDIETYLQQQLHSDGQLPSLAPAQALAQLGNRWSARTAFVDLVASLPPDLPQRVAEAFPDIASEVQQYIDQYGDRTIGELKLETHTMRVDPLLFYKYLLPYLTKTSPPTAAQSARHQPPLSSLGAWRTGIFRREALRLERTRLFGMYRSLFRQMGHLLSKQGLLPDAEAIFDLQLEELEAHWRGEGALPKLTTLASRRQDRFAWQQQDAAGRVYLPGRPLTSTSESSSAGPWRGQSAVAGCAEGEVVVIREAHELGDLRGKILVALRTDPGWAPLFPGCKAVLIEKGSALSHSVIMLRELGIPTLINLPGITQQLQSGDRIWVDATEGQIERR